MGSTCVAGAARHVPHARRPDELPASARAIGRSATGPATAPTWRSRSCPAAHRRAAAGRADASSSTDAAPARERRPPDIRPAVEPPPPSRRWRRRPPSLRRSRWTQPGRRPRRVTPFLRRRPPRLSRSRLRRQSRAARSKQEGDRASRAPPETARDPVPGPRGGPLGGERGRPRDLPAAAGVPRRSATEASRSSRSPASRWRPTAAPRSS